MYLARYAPLALALLLAPAAAPAQDWAKAQRVEVALSNFKIAPTTLHLKPGQAYVLHVSSSGGHSFEAKTFFAAANILPADRLKLTAGRVELDDGKSVDIHLVAPGPATFPTRCTHFLHAGFGMTGTIVVG